MSFQVYSFSYNNPERYAAMERRFLSVGVPLHWVPAVGPTDSEILPDDTSPRTTAMMLGHIRMLRAFLDTSGVEYGIFCEDDIFLRKDFASVVPVAIDFYQKEQLDILLLGYLINRAPCSVSGPNDFHMLGYGDDQWGSQMYLLDKAAAQKMVDAFSDKRLVTGPYSPDWTLTKYGNRALLYPMFAVESGAVSTTHEGQVRFHRQCFEFNYRPGLHI